MNVSITQAARTQRTTTRIVGAVGFLIFLMIAGIAAWIAWSSYERDQTWTHATATVRQLEILCDVEKKNGKNWDLTDTLPCEEAHKIVAEREGVFSSWRATEVEFAFLEYEAGGHAQQARVRSVVISDVPLTSGTSIPILVNPQNPIDLARPFTSSDVTTFWVMLGFGFGIWVLTVVIGMFVASRNRKAEEKRAVAVSLTDSHWGRS